MRLSTEVAKYPLLSLEEQVEKRSRAMEAAPRPRLSDLPPKASNGPWGAAGSAISPNLWVTTTAAAQLSNPVTDVASDVRLHQASLCGCSLWDPRSRPWSTVVTECLSANVVRDCVEAKRAEKGGGSGVPLSGLGSKMPNSFGLPGATWQLGSQGP